MPMVFDDLSLVSFVILCLSPDRKAEDTSRGNGTDRGPEDSFGHSPVCRGAEPKGHHTEGLAGVVKRSEGVRVSLYA